MVETIIPAEKIPLREWRHHHDSMRLSVLEMLPARVRHCCALCNVIWGLQFAPDPSQPPLTKCQISVAQLVPNFLKKRCFLPGQSGKSAVLAFARAGC